MPEIQEGTRIQFVGINGDVVTGRIASIDLQRDLVYVERHRKKPLILSRHWLMHDAEILKMHEAEDWTPFEAGDIYPSVIKVPMTPYKRPSDWWKKIPAFGWLLYIIGLVFIAFGVESFWDELARDNRGFFWFGFLFLAVGFFVHWRSHSHVE